MTAPLTILAEGHFGGSLALGCAIACTLAPLVYAVGLAIGARARKKNPAVGLYLAVALAVIFGIGLVPYWLRFTLGENTTGVVTGSEKKSTSNQGSTVVFTITLDSGGTIEETVENEVRDEMTEGQRVMIRHVPALGGFARLGDEATLGEGTAFGSLFMWGLLVALTVGFARKRERER